MQKENQNTIPALNSAASARSAVLDEAHIGDIHGAFGSICQHDIAPRHGWWPKIRTLMAIVGPGLIVMVGDNDAGGFSTYSQAGQNFGNALLWTLPLLVPVLYVNQEMVMRLGAVTGVGHARLILERFGKFWGAFSVIDLFLLNALTLVSEFIGINLGLQFLGLPKIGGVLFAAAVIIAAASTGNFRRFERFAMCLVFFSLLLVPLFVMVHPPMTDIAHGLFVPQIPGGRLADIMLLIIGIVGTTVAPWQLFFQQSYIVDKRVTPRYLKYLRVDLGIGFVIVIGGAIAIMGTAAATFAGHAEFGNFTDCLGMSVGLEKYFGRVPAVLFALALINYSIVGASAVSLSTAYAVSDVLNFKHSLHRKFSQAKVFYSVYAGLLLVAAMLVLTPGVPLGLLTNSVQVLAGVLLPSATVFLLLLCNDKAVLGPWVNSRFTNLYCGTIIAILVMLSIILTASVLYPEITDKQILAILIGGSIIAVVAALGTAIVKRVRLPIVETVQVTYLQRDTWRMPPLDELPADLMTPVKRVWMGVLRGYLLIAAGLVLARIVRLALFHH